MSQENVKPEQIQASVAAALSRLRGDAAPPSDAPDSAPTDAPAPLPGPTGMVPGAGGMGARPESPRAANDLRADPGLRSVQAVPHAAPIAAMTRAAQSTVPTQAESEPPLAKEPELPRAMFSRPGPTLSGPTEQQTQAEAPKAPTVQRPASPLARMMSSEAPAGGPTVEKTAAPEQQPDLLAGLPPPPLGDALTQESDDSNARRRRNRRILALAAAIVVVVAGFWLWGGGDDPADVPVITAEATPEKVKPADEGGLQVLNQNVQVLDNISSGQQPVEAETVLPPPEQPVAPPEPSVVETPQADPPAVIESGDATLEEVPAATAPTTTAPEPETATVEAPMVPASPAPGAAAADTQQAEAPAVPATPAVTAPEPAAPAPETASAPEPAPAPAPATTQEAAVTAPPAPAATGNARIQLAAVKSEDGARAEWAKMQKAYPELLGSLSLTVERVDKNGTIFYRIQAGPLADKNAAKSLCASLKSRGQDCIVAR